MSPFRHLVSTCSLVYGLLNLTFWCIPLLLLTLAGMTAPALKPRLRPPLEAIYHAAVRVNDWWFRHVLGYRWQAAAAGLVRDRTYLVIANHQSWADSFLIQTAITHSGPILKVLVKAELMRIPVLGLIFWAYDFPRLKRRARRAEDEPTRRVEDAERIKAACERLKQAPGAMLIYPEGTRFTEKKHRSGPETYRHLLPPRPGGFSTVLDALRDQAEAVVDLSIFYPESTSFWRFLSGGVSEPQLDVALIPIREIGDASAWLQRRWQSKDDWLTDHVAQVPSNH
jgi:1-acyl-sn-glycerol-3-phosphate acyltransferase